MRRNDLEISVHFSWLDVMLAVIGTVILIMSFSWMMKLFGKMRSHKKSKKNCECAEQD